MKRRIAAILASAWVIFLVIFFTASCAVDNSNGNPFALSVTPTATLPSSIPDNPRLPDFLDYVYPNYIECKTDYDKTLDDITSRGIGVTLWTDEIGTTPEGRRIYQSLIDRIALFIDEKEISQERMQIGDGLMDAGPYYLHWDIELSPGLHHARFEYANDLNVIQRYVWQFIITEPALEQDITMPTPIPTPSYLVYINPEPGEFICKTTYDMSLFQENLIGRRLSVTIWPNKAGIAGVNSVETILIKRTALFIDGNLVHPKNATIHLMGSTDGSGAYDVSWAIDLPTGLHEALLQVRGDDGTIYEYKWYFVLTHE
jgi:hypothetical protein